MRQNFVTTLKICYVDVQFAPYNFLKSGLFHGGKKQYNSNNPISSFTNLKNHKNAKLSYRSTVYSIRLFKKWHFSWKGKKNDSTSPVSPFTNQKLSKI